MNEFEKKLKEKLDKLIEKEFDDKPICDIKKIKSQIDFTDNKKPKKRNKKNHDKDIKTPIFNKRFSLLYSSFALIIGLLLGISSSSLFISKEIIIDFGIDNVPNIEEVEVSKKTINLLTKEYFDLCIAFDGSNNPNNINNLNFIDANNPIEIFTNDIDELKDGNFRIYFTRIEVYDYIFIVNDDYILKYESFFPYTSSQIIEKIETRTNIILDETFLNDNYSGIYLKYFIENNKLNYYFELTNDDKTYKIYYENGDFKIFIDGDLFKVNLRFDMVK